MKRTETQINIHDFPVELHPYLAGADIFDSSSSPKAKVYFISPRYYLKVGERGSLMHEAFMARWFYKNGLGVEVIWYGGSDRDYMLTNAAEGKDCTEFLENPERLCSVMAGAMKMLHSLPAAELPACVARGDYEKALKSGGGNYDSSILMPCFMKPSIEETTLKEGTSSGEKIISNAKIAPEEKISFKEGISSKEEAWAIMQENKHRLKCDTLIHGDFCLPNIIVKDGRFSCFIDLAMAGLGDKHIDLYWAPWSLQYNLGTEKYTDYFLDLYGRENFEYDMLRVIAAFEAFG